MKANSIKGKSTEEIGSELRQVMRDDFKPTLALIFISKSMYSIPQKVLDKIFQPFFTTKPTGREQVWV